jgi:hypothetical protein
MSTSGAFSLSSRLWPQIPAVFVSPNSGHWLHDSMRLLCPAVATLGSLVQKVHPGRKPSNEGLTSLVFLLQGEKKKNSLVLPVAK